MKNQKTVQANYSQEVVTSLVSDYQAAYALNPDNTTVLSVLATKYGKTVHSIRAKLASLKVYNSANTVSTIGKGSNTKKEDIVKTLSFIVGYDLTGLEVAPKNILLVLLSYTEQQRDKIDQLINDLTDDEPLVVDDINDND